MTRWLVGTFDTRGTAHAARLAAALMPNSTSLAQAGALQVVYTGPESQARAPLCILDGFLDNAPDLRAELGCDGDSTPETLVIAGWQRWGLDLLARMRGDWTVVIWDNARGEGLLARDQLGVRSLFVHDQDGALHFANEVCHLLALLPTAPAPDRVSMAHWMAMSNRPGTATLYAGVRRLNPGSALILDRRGTHEVQYWAPRFSEPLGGTESQRAEAVREKFELAIRRRTDAHGLTGVLMSGGLDSSAVAAVAGAQAPGRVWAQSAVFPEHPAVDESVLIDELRERLNLPGMTAEVRAGGLIASAQESMEQWKLPLRSWGDFWALPLLRAAAQAGVVRTLGGDGGDELFGVRAYLMSDRIRAGHPLDALRLLRELPGAGSNPSRREMAKVYADVALAGALPYRLHAARERRSAVRDVAPWLLSPVAHDLLGSEDPLAWKRLDGPLWWAQTAHVLTRSVEEGGMFDHQRRRAASAGLEARHAMFDLDLVELCLALPPRTTFDRYRSRPVLREAMKGLLPDSVRMRPEKSRFDSLLVDCLTGPDGALTRELLCDPAAEIRSYVDQPTMRRALFDARDGAAAPSFQWMWQVWRLVTAECWLRSLAGRSLETAPSAPRIHMRSTPPAPAIAG